MAIEKPIVKAYGDTLFCSPQITKDVISIHKAETPESFEIRLPYELKFEVFLPGCSGYANEPWRCLNKDFDIMANAQSRAGLTDAINDEIVFLHDCISLYKENNKKLFDFMSKSISNEPNTGTVVRRKISHMHVFSILDEQSNKAIEALDKLFNRE